MTDTSPAIKALHAAYCRETGNKLELTMRRWFSWEVFRSKGWSETDLKLVVGWIGRNTSSKVYRQYCLGFRKLIEDLDYFEERLKMARTDGRRPKMDKGKADVLRATDRHHEPPTSKCKTCEEIMQQHQQMAALLKDFREKHL